MIYAALTNSTLILVLNYITNFFTCFGAIFVLVVNMILLKTPTKLSLKKQNGYIILYALLVLIGMIPFYLLGEGWGVWIDEYKPRFSPIFLFYILAIQAGFVVAPIISTSLKIYKSFETKELKRKWRIYFLATIGAFSIPYSIWISNYVFRPDFRLFVGVYDISILLWGYLMYYGLVSLLDLSTYFYLL
jgi:hypothetical protein